MKQDIIKVSSMKTSVKRINYEPQRTLTNEYNVIQPQKVNNIHIICLKCLTTVQILCKSPGIKENKCNYQIFVQKHSSYQ